MPMGGQEPSPRIPLPPKNSPSEMKRRVHPRSLSVTPRPRRRALRTLQSVQRRTGSSLCGGNVHTPSLQAKMRAWAGGSQISPQSSTNRGLRALWGGGAPRFVSGDVILKLGDYFLGAVYTRNKYSNTLRRLQIIIKRHRRNHIQTR